MYSQYTLGNDYIYYLFIIQRWQIKNLSLLGISVFCQSLTPKSFSFIELIDHWQDSNIDMLNFLNTAYVGVTVSDNKLPMVSQKIKQPDNVPF